MQPTHDELKKFLAGQQPSTGPHIKQIFGEADTLTAVISGYTRRLSITTAGAYASSHTIAGYRKALGVPADAREERKTRHTAQSWHVVSFVWSVQPPAIQSDFFGGNL